MKQIFTYEVFLTIWKMAQVRLLPKKSLQEALQKLQTYFPVSLLYLISTRIHLLVDSAVNDYTEPAVLKVLDPSQYGAA